MPRIRPALTKAAPLLSPLPDPPPGSPATLPGFGSVVFPVSFAPPPRK